MKMRVLITGIEGFVGPHLKNVLEQNDIEVYGSYLLDPVLSSPNFFHMDLLDKSEIRSVLSKIQPDAIFHLAGFSSVRQSFENPNLCKKVNIEGTENILKTLIELEFNPNIVVVSSGEVYGIPKFTPITESHPIAPRSPYGESRLLQEEICLKYFREHDMQIKISRSFNHTGPGQPDVFVTPSFAHQIVNIERGFQKKIRVGNLHVIRDFCDVRDVSRAYYALMTNGSSGEIYNVCSGKGYEIQHLLDILISNSTSEITIEKDESRIPPKDIPILVGDYTKLKTETNWFPEIPFEKTLYDVLNYWRNSPN